MTTLVWFRQDLRLTDNPALDAAYDRGGPVVPVYILEQSDRAGPRRPGGAALWWLDQSLVALSADLAALGSRLILCQGNPQDVLPALARTTGADAVYWNRRYEVGAIAVDRAIKADLTDSGLEVRSFNASLLFEPWTILTRAGDPYRVYTPFWRACRARADLPAPTGRVAGLPAPARWPAGEERTAWALSPTKPDWAGGLRAAWTPGEAGAQRRLHAFLDHAIRTYRSRRDIPADDGTSRLSPHLHWGEIGPRQVWAAVQMKQAAGAYDGCADDVEVFLKELVWREFSYHLLYHFPQLPEQNLNRRFAELPWHDDEGALKAWQQGRTGYPIVDAGMRQLYETGWMHNRVRMVVASFLTKHLLIHWRHGEAWFWDTLVDADLASNSASWQWVAGCGADAAPFFRIFNPTLQGRKFDPSGDYVRRWVPELSKLGADHVHEPAKAPDATLKAAGVRLGIDYPRPLIEHQVARKRALDAYDIVKQAA